MWVCPDCNHRDKLMVTIVTSANLTQDDNGDNFETEVMGDHEWGGDSSMACGGCGYVGTARQFECNLPIANLQHPDGPMPNPSTPMRRRHTDD